MTQNPFTMDSLGAVPFNMVHGRGVTATKLGLEGVGCQLKIYFEKKYGEGVISRNLNIKMPKKLGWRWRGGHGNFKEKHWRGQGSQIFCNPTPMYDIKWNSPNEILNLTGVKCPGGYDG